MTHVNKKLWFLALTAFFIAFLLNAFGLYLFFTSGHHPLASPVTTFYYTVGIIFATSFAIFSLFCYVLNLAVGQAISVSIFVVTTLLGHFELAKMTGSVIPFYLFIFCWILNLLLVVLIVAKIIEAYQIATSIYKPTIITMLVFMLGWGLIGFFSSQWVSLMTMTNNTYPFRDFTLTIGAMLPLAMTTFVRRFQIDPTSIIESFKLRLQLSKQGGGTYILQSCLIICFFVTIMRIVQFLCQSHEEFYRFIDTILIFHPIIYLFAYSSVKELINATKIVQSGDLASKLLNESAIKFLFRHEKSDETWAAIVGFQSASYVIDHDPQELLQHGLPATIRQIRTEEIQRCINHMLKTTNLQLLEIGHNFHGALDPEVSMRPCLDLLRLFSCLYLDASPMVERRIKGLTSLIPVVDPMLSIRLPNDELSALLKKNYWFFFLDYGWIDQRITKSPKNVRYDISIGPHSAHKIMMSIRKQERIANFGNCVWITPESRIRILQEASVLSNIIEPCPLMIEGIKQEELYFIMRFEQLIPRLQRYFDLDSMRQEIIDFEPSPEGAQFLNLFNLQVERAKTKEEILAILQTIQSVPWRGFKEKDGALRLVINAHEKIKFLAQNDRKIVLDDTRREIYTTIRTIGYPSQVLHTAQISKFTLRDMDILIKTAKDISSPRFAEAWLILATQPFSSQEIAASMVRFLKEIPLNEVLRNQRLVQTKILEIICNLAKSSTVGDQAIKELVLSVLDWHILVNAPTDLVCYFLDTVHYLENQINMNLGISAQDWNALDRHIEKLTAMLGENHPKIIALKSRR